MVEDTGCAAPEASGARPGFTPNPQKRAQILAAARRIFFADGFGAATIDKIAADSTVSKATIYKYFESKQQIFVALMREGTDGTGPMARPDFRAATPEAALTQIGTEILRRMLDPTSMQMFRLMVAESARFPELGATFEEEGPRRGQRFIAQYLTAVDASGRLAIPNPSLAAGQFVGLCQAGIFMRAQLTEYTPSDEYIAEVVDSAVRVFVRGYAVG